MNIIIASSGPAGLHRQPIRSTDQPMNRRDSSSLGTWSEGAPRGLTLKWRWSVIVRLLGSCSWCIHVTITIFERRQF